MRRLHPIVKMCIFFIVFIVFHSCQQTTPVVEEPLSDIEAIENNLKRPVIFEGEEKTPFLSLTGWIFIM